MERSLRGMPLYYIHLCRVESRRLHLLIKVLVDLVLCHTVRNTLSALRNYRHSICGPDLLRLHPAKTSRPWFWSESASSVKCSQKAPFFDHWSHWLPLNPKITTLELLHSREQSLFLIWHTFDKRPRFSIFSHILQLLRIWKSCIVFAKNGQKICILHRWQPVSVLRISAIRDMVSYLFCDEFKLLCLDFLHEWFWPRTFLHTLRNQVTTVERLNIWCLLL